MADKLELAGCLAFPARETCPQDWCDFNQYRDLCQGCPHFHSGRTRSLYQQQRDSKGGGHGK